MAKHKTHYEDCDVLVVGGGMAGTGATFEADDFQIKSVTTS